MPTMTITPSFVNPPGEGKKMGSVKLKDNTLMLALPSVLSQMQPRSTYEVEYTEETPTFKYRTIKSVKAASAVAPASGGGYGQDKDTPMRIFICGAYNNAIQAGQLNILNEDDCLKAVEIQKRVWRQTLSVEAAAKAKKDEDFEDSIPY